MVPVFVPVLYTTTLLAQIWSELGEVEQGKVEQVILDYVEAQQDVEVDRENGRYVKGFNTN